MRHSNWTQKLTYDRSSEPDIFSLSAFQSVLQMGYPSQVFIKLSIFSKTQKASKKKGKETPEIFVIKLILKVLQVCLIQFRLQSAKK